MGWVDEARARLMAARSRSGGWGYRRGGASFAEPTALAVLALRCHDQDCPQGIGWLAGLQQADGSVPICVGFDMPRWPTALAVLAWRSAPGLVARADRAVAFLLGWQGRHWPRRADSPVAHDTAIVGWPWVRDTHSWVEPTGYAICALRRSGRAEHARVAEGKRMLLDRAIRGGGWNYGNSAVFGTPLIPSLASSGVALVALGKQPGQQGVAEGAAYLARQVARVRSPLSLGWALLGLAAVGRRPAAAGGWLKESFSGADGQTLRTDELALLLMAARAEVAIRLLGEEAGK